MTIAGKEIKENKGRGENHILNIYKSIFYIMISNMVVLIRNVEEVISSHQGQNILGVES